jgi:ribonuclease PH
MDGFLSAQDLNKAMKMATEACKQIYEVQKAALKDRYKTDGDSNE